MFCIILRHNIAHILSGTHSLLSPLFFASRMHRFCVAFLLSLNDSSVSSETRTLLSVRNSVPYPKSAANDVLNSLAYYKYHDVARLITHSLVVMNESLKNTSSPYRSSRHKKTCTFANPMKVSNDIALILSNWRGEAFVDAAGCVNQHKKTSLADFSLALKYINS